MFLCLKPETCPFRRQEQFRREEKCYVTNIKFTFVRPYSYVGVAYQILLLKFQTGGLWRVMYFPFPALFRHVDVKEESL